MKTQIVAKNITDQDIYFRNLSIEDCKISANSEVNLSEYNSIANIQNDSQLLEHVDSGDIVFEIDGTELTSEQSKFIVGKIDHVFVPVPDSATDSGKVGQLAYDNEYVYYCVAENIWVRWTVETSW